jgi:hypothetical protein
MKAPQNRRFYFEVRVPPLWPTDIGERRIKERCYGENVGELIGNLGNILRT